MYKCWNISDGVKHHNVYLLTSMCILVKHLTLTFKMFGMQNYNIEQVLILKVQENVLRSMFYIHKWIVFGI